jgi:hypothetical protein
MNTENANPAWTSAANVAEKTVAQLKEDNERLTQALYMLQQDKAQLGVSLFNLMSEPLETWLNEMAPDFLETHFDIANYTDDIADALPEKEIEFDCYQDEIRDVVQDIVKYAEVKITV